VRRRQVLTRRLAAFLGTTRRLPRRQCRRLNRSDGPEDDGLQDRCLRSGLPEFGQPVRRQLSQHRADADGISIFYDVNQGQGCQRTSS